MTGSERRAAGGCGGARRVRRRVSSVHPLVGSDPGAGAGPVALVRAGPRPRPGAAYQRRISRSATTGRWSEASVSATAASRTRTESFDTAT